MLYLHLKTILTLNKVCLITKLCEVIKVKASVLAFFYAIFLWLVCGVGGNFTLGIRSVFQTSSSLFNLDGVRTVIALIKIEGLVTPLATIFSLMEATHHIFYNSLYPRI